MPQVVFAVSVKVEFLCTWQLVAVLGLLLAPASLMDETTLLL